MTALNQLLLLCSVRNSDHIVTLSAHAQQWLMCLLDSVFPLVQVEMLPDIAHAPRILPNYTQHITATLKKVIYISSTPMRSLSGTSLIAYAVERREALIHINLSSILGSG